MSFFPRREKEKSKLMPEDLFSRFLKLPAEEAYILVREELDALMERTRQTDPALYHLAEIVRFLGFMSQAQERNIDDLKEKRRKR